MSQLYWACSQAAPEEILHLLAEHGYEASLVGLVREILVIAIFGADPRALQLTAGLLADRRIASAALTSQPLSEKELWLPAEWKQCMAVEKNELGRMDVVSERLQVKRDQPRPDLTIFEVRRIAPSPDEVVPLAGAGEAAARVREHPQDYYGDLADPFIGGANALYAAGFEAARARNLPEDQILVASAQALGFRRDAGETSVTAWRKKSVIAADAVGFSLGSEAEVADLFAAHVISVDRDDLGRKASAWRDAGFRFGVGLVLRGLKDPPIVIPVGSVYQQPSMGSAMQNLAVARPVSTTVAAGATVPLILPAWCLNPTFLPPSGPLVPTPLIMAFAGGTQDEVWDSIRSRYRGGP
jgi:hypothetical protein